MRFYRSPPVQGHHHPYIESQLTSDITTPSVSLDIEEHPYSRVWEVGSLLLIGAP